MTQYIKPCFRTCSFWVILLVAVANTHSSPPLQAQDPTPFLKHTFGSDRFIGQVIAEATGIPERIASGTSNGYVRLWNTTTQEMLWEVRVFEGVSVRHLGFAGQTQVVVALETGWIQLLDAISGHELRRFQLPPEASIDYILTSDKHLLINLGTTTLIYALADGALLHTYTGTTLGEDDFQTALSPDGAYVAWFKDAEVYFAPIDKLNHPTRLKNQELEGTLDIKWIGELPVLLLFSPDSRVLAFAANGEVSFWTIADGKPTELSQGTAPALTKKDWEKIIPKESREYVSPQAENPIVAMFSTDSKTLIVTTEFLEMPNRSVWSLYERHNLFDVATGKYLDAAKKTKILAATTWTPNHKAFPGPTSNLPLWLFPSGQKLTAYVTHHAAVFSVPSTNLAPEETCSHFTDILVSHDGKRIAARTDDFEPLSEYDSPNKDCVAIWRDGQLEQVIGQWIWNFAFAQRDGSKLWVFEYFDEFGTIPKQAHQWDLTQKPAQSTSAPYTLLIQNVYALPDGDWLALTHHSPDDYPGDSPINHSEYAARFSFKRLNPDLSEDPTVQYALILPIVLQSLARLSIATHAERIWDDAGTVWDLKSGQALFTLKEIKVEHVIAGALSEDGKTLALLRVGPHSSDLIEFWDVDTKTMHGSIPASSPFENDDQHTRLMFSPDGNALLNNVNTNIFIHKRMPDGTFSPTPIALSAPNLYAESLTFSGDGLTLVSEGNNIFHTWDWLAIVSATSTTPKTPSP